MTVLGVDVAKNAWNGKADDTTQRHRTLEVALAVLSVERFSDVYETM